MTKLSVNLNKIALLRNARNIGIPNLLRAAEICIQAGAQGITVHPRPDQRHVRISDVSELSRLLTGFPQIELNIEGNPFPQFLEIVRHVKPAQCTLVPDTPDARTSDHGWDLQAEGARLEPVIAELKAFGCRVSLFMDVDSNEWERARRLGADRVELYTQPYAAAFALETCEATFEMYLRAAQSAQSAGLGVNAGHDLNLQNLGKFCQIPGLLEVSIGHALVADALELGLSQTVRAYLDVLNTAL
jgi:pyridoxine 5-phosphate synthase